jgi:alkylhydroperoxidase family enzyme
MWIRTIAPEEAQGLVKRVYEAAVRRAGKVFQIVRAMSLAPATMEASLDLYKTVMLAPGSLARRRREMLAVVVSRANDCHY